MFTLDYSRLEIFGGGDVTHVSELWVRNPPFNDSYLTNQNGGFFSLFRKNIKDFYFNFEILEGELFLLCKKVLEMLSHTQF